MHYDFGALTDIFRDLPEDAAEKAASAVNAHPRIFVYGAGRSGLMLKAFAMRLSQMGRVVYVVGETITPALEENDLLILASASGNTASVCRCAAIAKEVGAELFLLTASMQSALTAIAPPDVCFRTPTKDDGSHTGSIMGTLFEQAVLLFLDMVVLHLDVDRASMRRRHANLE